MTKKKLALMMEWLRPAGIGLVFFFAYYFGNDAISRFHILGPFVVMLMSGTVAFESLVLGKVASEKMAMNPIVLIKFNRVWPMQPLPSRLCLFICWIGGDMRMPPLLQRC